MESQREIHSVVELQKQRILVVEHRIKGSADGTSEINTGKCSDYGTTNIKCFFLHAVFKLMSLFWLAELPCEG